MSLLWIFSLSFWLEKANAVACTVGDFPKILGAAAGATYFDIMDLHPATTAIVAAGCTNSQALTTGGTSTTSWLSIILYYQGTNFNHVWSKQITGEESWYYSVVFSVDGAKILA
jgi:hypothetical protein